MSIDTVTSPAIDPEPGQPGPALVAEIAQMLAALVADAIREAMSDIDRLPPKMLFTAREMHEITGLPVSWFEDEGAAEHIPSRKIGEKYRRWSLADAEAIIEVCEVQPSSGPLLKAFRARKRALSAAA